MAADDKKSLAIMVLGKGKPMSKDSDGEGEGDDDEREGMKAAAADILDAIESKDEDALADALEAFIHQCKPPKDEEPEDA